MFQISLNKKHWLKIQSYLSARGATGRPPADDK